MKIASNRIADVVGFFREELKSIYESGEIETFIAYCFEEYLGIKKAAVVLNADATVSESELLKFHFAIKDLKRHKPIQYILGKADFYGLKLNVNEHVLIPRPETEELVDLVIKEIGEWRREKGEGRAESGERGRENGKGRMESRERLSILDIGTGSGCIAISLKKNLSAADVYAVDVSERALEMAKQNALQNAVDIKFFNYDILFSASSFPVYDLEFDIIISNPPYISISEKEQIEKNVIDYEPHLALFVDDNEPLLFYKAITNFALNHLKKNGKIYFEINQRFAVETKQLLEYMGVKNVTLLKDLNDNYRIVKGTI